VSEQNVQVAPYPTELLNLVQQCRYRAHEGWSVRLAEINRDKDSEGNVVGHGLTLVILTRGYDTYNPDLGPNYSVNHYFIVPAATYNLQSWTRWLLDCFIKVETHEAMENFVVAGERPFAPTHGPGDDPYVVHEYATDTQRRTRFTGEIAP
jgi:hypothetical protein